MIGKVTDIRSRKSEFSRCKWLMTKDLTNLQNGTIFRMDFLSKLLIVHLICHYAVQVLTAIFINPEEIIAVGLHERIGDCNEMVPLETILKVWMAGCYWTQSNRRLIRKFADASKTKVFVCDWLRRTVLRLSLFTECETAIRQQCMVHHMWDWIWVSHW